MYYLRASIEKTVLFRSFVSDLTESLGSVRRCVGHDAACGVFHLQLSLNQIQRELSTQATSFSALTGTEKKRKDEIEQRTEDLCDKAPSSKRAHQQRRRASPKGHSIAQLPRNVFPLFAENKSFRFKILHKSTKSSARLGLIETPHGTVETPGFVAVATNGALKAVDWSAANAAGLQLAFANTYHLLLHPGADAVAQAGGLHRFINRPNHPLITDSGGFQVFSLAHGTVHEELQSLKRARRLGTVGDRHRKGNLVERVDESGVLFRSYRDGTRLLLSPESSIEAQKKLGADIILPLDQLTPFHVDEKELVQALDRSHRWEARSLLAHLEDPRHQAIYGIVHGGSDPTLRRRSALYVSDLPFDGLAIGGALGRTRKDMLDIIKHTMQCLKDDGRPVHVLGIADPFSATQLASMGIDTMDSCYATRVGRHGGLLTDQGTVKVAVGENKTKYGLPALESCDCHTCRHHSLGYLYHLVKSREPLAAALCSLHNIHFMCKMFEEIRNKIKRNEL